MSAGAKATIARRGSMPIDGFYDMIGREADR